MISPHRKADVTFTWIRDLDEQGQFSKVYLAHDENLSHEIVIKQIEKKPEQSRDQYFSEASLLYKYAHPNIVQVQYAAEDTDNIYIAMPFYRSGTINQRLNIDNLTPREIIRYAIQFIGGLHHIHTKKLMHFDIKPNNIMLSNRDEAMLSDFGLSELVNDSLRARPQCAYYFHTPPEYFTKAKDEHFNYTFDIYQTGVTLYRMCIGNQRFKEEISVFQNVDELAHSLNSGLFPARKYSSHIPKKLIAVINKCLEIDPNNRYQSCLDILNGLAAIKESDGALDWREQRNVNGGTLEWNKEIEGAILQLTYDSNIKKALCYRVYPDGTRRKHGKASLDNCSTYKLYSILKEC
ncbi:serine/threonine-protein kinase [Pragia fontium]|uniref:serine/threonine-protein kinase n=1 Tax=Pragia fontium TaxID=82985 RepID=UPI000F6B643C|nr:serine/threonine-protein kinase [Pragia fontium]VEJ54662.1 Serine/threonine-protein kinase PrkC [Pragia fontium]